jgi:hypothetical protein
MKCLFAILAVCVVSFTSVLAEDKTPKAKTDGKKLDCIFVIKANEKSFKDAVADIRVYEYHPFIADKAADLVGKKIVEKISHTKGTKSEVKHTFHVKLKPQMKYYVTIKIYKNKKMEHKDLLFFINGFQKVYQNGTDDKVNVVLKGK